MRKMYLFILSAMMICTTGCGKNGTTLEPMTEAATETSKETNTENTIEDPEADPQEEVSENVTDISGVYPNITGLTEVKMGITNDLCSVKVPLSYVLAGVSYDENMQKQTMKGLDSATTTVEEAIDAGSFSTGEHIAEFSMTSLEDDTMLSAKLYPASRTPWEKFTEHFTDAKTLGTDQVPGIFYHTESGGGSKLAVAVKVSDDATLELVYTGSLGDEIGEDTLAENLYDLVTVL